MGERERKWEKGERLQVLQVLRLSLSLSVYVCGSYGSTNDDDDDAACGNGQRQAAAADRAAA